MNSSAKMYWEKQQPQWNKSENSGMAFVLAAILFIASWIRILGSYILHKNWIKSLELKAQNWTLLIEKSFKWTLDSTFYLKLLDKIVPSFELIKPFTSLASLILLGL